MTRLQAGEIDVTGPMFGHKMQAPPEGSASAAREQAALDRAQLKLADFAAAGALAEGTRRPLTVPVTEASVMLADSPASIMLSFVLPSGAYATVLVDEIAKPQ
jgi:tRNA(Glu) U13 pseudouridine synthase TruD